MLLGLSQIRAGRASPLSSLPPSAGAQCRLQSGQRVIEGAHEALQASQSTQRVSRSDAPGRACGKDQDPEQQHHQRTQRRKVLGLHGFPRPTALSNPVPSFCGRRSFKRFVAHTRFVAFIWQHSNKHLVCVMGRLVHTGLGSSSLVAHVLQYPPPPHANSFVLGPAVINTHLNNKFCHLWHRLCTTSCSSKHTHRRH